MRCDCTASHRMVHGAIHSQTVCVGRRNCARPQRSPTEALGGGRRGKNGKKKLSWRTRAHEQERKSLCNPRERE